MIDAPSKLKMFFYYLSFILLYTTVTFVASMHLMDYEDKWDGRTNGTMWKWSTMETSHKLGYVTFMIAQFPFGLLFGLLTGIYNNGLFAFIVNPLFISWSLLMIFRNYGIICKPSYKNKLYCLGINGANNCNLYFDRINIAHIKPAIIFGPKAI